MNGSVIGTHRGEKGESERRGRGEIEIERQRETEAEGTETERELSSAMPQKGQETKRK